MPNNKLILRTLTSPYGDTTKGSVLSHDDVDNNFIFLKGKAIQTGSTSADNTLTLTSIDGSTISIPISGNSGTIKTVTGMTYNLLSSDYNNIYTNVSGCTVLVPALPVPHSSIHTSLVNADITFSGNGVTINSYAGHTKSNGQYAPASIFNLTTTTYILGGNTKI